MHAKAVADLGRSILRNSVINICFENIRLIEGLDHLDSGEFPHVFMLQQKKKPHTFEKIMNSVTKLNLFDARI